MLCESEGVINFLEGVGTKSPGGKKLPFAALPTTAGTGSECTKNAVLSSPGPGGFKKSLRHDNYIPDLALIDPLWLADLPRDTAASCGMDAFSQLLESYLSTAASPFSDALALKGLEGFLTSFTPLLKGCATEEDLSAIALGASLSGLTLANAGLGTVHGLAGTLGGLMTIAHGTACGLLMPPVMKETFRRLSEEDPADPALKKAGNLGRLLASKGSDRSGREGLDLLIKQLDTWAELARLPGLKELGVDESLLAEAASAGGNKNNPYHFTEAECLQILKSIYK
jgi:alcohol dehydrogenase class IV